MKLSETLHEHIAAAFTGIGVQSREHDDALAEFGRLCAEHDGPMAVRDIDRGLQVRGQAVEPAGKARRGHQCSGDCEYESRCHMPADAVT